MNLTFKRVSSALMLSLVCFAGYAQQTITGNVKDASGEPMIGVTILADGQAVAITDIDGNFSVPNVKSSTALTFSYVGYLDQKVKVGNQSSFNITMKEDQEQLDEVVVVGYGTMKKRDLTGSVASVKSDDIAHVAAANAMQAMQAKVPGVDLTQSDGQAGGGISIKLRGNRSILGSNDPLVIVDGVEYGSTIDINPSDIESMDILKDAASTAIYGTRGANGVIIITTKKGRKGSKPTFSYNGDVTVSTIQKKYKVLNAAQYKDLISSVDGLDASLLGNADTDWQDQVLRTSVSTNHSISMQGGTKNMPYRVSAGYNISNGIVKTSWMRRFNASVNLAPSFLNNHLNFNITAKYMYEKDRYADAGGAIGAALSMNPTQPVYGEGDGYKFTGGYYQDLINASFSDPSWTKTTNSNATQNPVAMLNNKYCLANANDFSGNVEVDYKIHGFEDLHIHASLGAQYTATNQHDDNSIYSYSNNYYGWNGMTYYWKYNIVGNVYAQYAHTFGVHGIDIMAGAEDSHYHRSGYDEGQGTDYFTGAAKDPALRSEKEWATHNSLVSYFGRFNYNLLDRYLLTATFRADGSSRFADGHKWGYFPSAAFAWKINNEPFMKNLTWLNDFKLRLGWGKTGQQNGIDDFYYAPLYVRGDQYSMYPFGDTYYYTTRPNKYNSNLTWEKTTTWNAGIDFAALNNRFTVALDGYLRNTSDLLSTVSVPAGTTFGDELLKNIGSLRNYGLELSFDVKPVVTKDFTWDLTYNVGWNHNEITKLEAGAQDWVWVKNKISRGNNAYVQKNKVGEPVNSFFVFQQVYDENGKPIEGCYVDRNGDGKINDDDRYYYKDPAPDVIMGLTTKFIYKNWDLSAAFHASFNNYVYYDFLANHATISTSGLYSNSAFRNSTPEAIALGFTGTTTNQNAFSDYFVRNASYLKCTNITLGYTFPALLKYAGQEYFSGRVFFTVQNPFIISKYKGIDPEVSNGIDRELYPRPMSFQLGLNLNF